VCVASLRKSFQEFPSVCALSHTTAGVVEPQTAGELLTAKRDERGRGRSLVRFVIPNQGPQARHGMMLPESAPGSRRMPAVDAAIQLTSLTPSMFSIVASSDLSRR
jgi:hypothetical protein